MLPERGIDAVQQTGRCAPVDGMVHLDALVNLAEELVDPSNDCGEGWTESLLGPVRLWEDLVHVLLKAGALDAALVVGRHLDEAVRDVDKLERAFQIQKLERLLLPVLLVDLLHLCGAPHNELRHEAENAVSRLAIPIATPLVVLVVVADTGVS